MGVDEDEVSGCSENEEDEAMALEVDTPAVEEALLPPNTYVHQEELCCIFPSCWFGCRLLLSVPSLSDSASDSVLGEVDGEDSKPVRSEETFEAVVSIEVEVAWCIMRECG